MRRPRPPRGCRAIEKKKSYETENVWLSLRLSPRMSLSEVNNCSDSQEIAKIYEIRRSITAVVPILKQIQSKPSDPISLIKVKLSLCVLHQNIWETLRYRSTHS
jgi:hypothetical protein